MRLITKEEALEFLIRRKIPDYQYVGNGLGHTFLWHQSGIPEDEREAYVENVKKLVAAYREELVGMPDDNFETLLYEEQACLDQEILQKLALDAGLLLEADLDYWTKMSLWQMEEAIALAFGKNPAVVNQEALKGYLDSSDFAFEYAKLRDLAVRAMRANELSSPMKPVAFVEWAERVEIELPSAMVELVNRRSHQGDQRLRKSLQDGESDSVSGGSLAKRSAYWNSLEKRLEKVIAAYPSLEKGPGRISKSKTLHEWLAGNFELKSREIEIAKKVLSDLYEELN